MFFLLCFYVKHFGNSKFSLNYNNCKQLLTMFPAWLYMIGCSAECIGESISSTIQLFVLLAVPMLAGCIVCGKSTAFNYIVKVKLYFTLTIQLNL